MKKKIPSQHKILVVDDEEIIRKTVSGLLQHYNYKVVTAGNGLECLQIMSSQKFGLVILDIIMPGMSGIEVLQKIKEKYKDTEVIMITGYADKEKAIETFRLGAYDFIEKPFESGEIMNTIAHCLKQFELKREVERKSRALKESEEQYHAIFNEARDGIVLTDLETGNIFNCNPEFERQAGRKLKELKKMKIWDLRPYDKKEAARDAFLEIREKGTGNSDELEFQRPDGSIVPIEFVSKRIKIRGRRFIQSITRDISIRKNMEEEARFIQTKLIHVNKMTSLGMLASGIAHEINNPNNFIMFNAPLISEAWQDAIKILSEYYRVNGEFALGGIPFSEMREVIPRLLSGITDGSRRIKNIVDNLKDFSRQDKAILNGKVDVNKVIKAAVLILSNQINKYTENFNLNCEENLPAVKGCAQQLEQVVINLIMNALQALTDKKCRVLVSTKFINEESGSVMIKVRDDGIGMSKEVLDRVTEPFFTTKLDKGGTGLGLSISYSIIKEHQGSLEFESNPGWGTTAIIKLPAG